MLTFLRKIRKSLIESGSARKYVLYAIGEILLVMIGILLALQVNNWNEVRKQRNEETKLLGSIYKQFNYNLNEVERAIWTTQMIQQKCIQLLQNMGNKGVELSRYEADSLVFSGLRRIVTFDVSNGILDDILNSGRLHIISSDTLREKLANWPSALEDVKEDERWTVEIRNNQILPFLQQYYSIHHYSGIDSGFDWGYKEVFKMKEFENLVDQHRNLNYANERNYRDLKAYIAEIITLCSIELSNRNKI
jgi:hypothetical protein